MNLSLLSATISRKMYSIENTAIVNISSLSSHTAISSERFGNVSMVKDISDKTMSD